LSISKRLRFNVLQRDGFRCVYCGRRPPAVNLEVDHKIPRSQGGQDNLKNLVAACWDCNRGKGAIVSDHQGQFDYYSLDQWAEDMLDEVACHELDEEELADWMLPKPLAPSLNIRLTTSEILEISSSLPSAEDFLPTLWEPF